MLYSCGSKDEKLVHRDESGESVRGQVLPIWPRPKVPFILQLHSYLLYRFFGSCCKSQEAEVDSAHYQVLTHGLNEPRPALAEQDKW